MPAQSPHPSFHFRVDAGFSRLGFLHVQLPRLERDVIRYREGSDPVDTVRQLPGLLRVGDCVLQRGVIPADHEFFQWMNAAHAGQAERRDLTVSLLDEQHQPTLTWRLRNTFPVGLEWSPLDAQGGGVLIETLRLSVEAMDLLAT
ncbi:MAG: phage tail protein [Holophagaceae bacterium]